VQERINTLRLIAYKIYELLFIITNLQYCNSVTPVNGRNLLTFPSHTIMYTYFNLQPLPSIKKQFIRTVFALLKSLMACLHLSSFHYLHTDLLV